MSKYNKYLLINNKYRFIYNKFYNWDFSFLSNFQYLQTLMYVLLNSGNPIKIEQNILIGMKIKVKLSN